MGISQPVAPPTPSQDGVSQNMETMVQGLVKSSLTQIGVIPQETPDQSQAQSETKTKTATAEAQPATCTPVKPAAPQVKAPAQAQPQAPAQAQMRPPAPAQPLRPAPAYFPQPQAAPPQGARRVPTESLDEDRLSDFPEREASLIARQAWLELLDWIANFCELERGHNEEQKRVMKW